MTDGKLLVEKLIEYAKLHLHLVNSDEIYVRNLLLRELRLPCPYEGADVEGVAEMAVPDELVAELESYAVEKGLCKEEERELYSTHIFGLLTPLPSVINAEFFRLRAERGIAAACAYLYDISVMNNYIRKTAIEKNILWNYDDGRTGLEVTINLSKPEKDNKDIAKLLSAPVGKKYPACALCKENEGFSGTLTLAPRSNIRTVSLTLGGEDWFVQYSPYAYFEEHCIAISKTHSAMKVVPQTAEKLLDFVDVFSDYFIGSNASLPIIGGSILNHEHYQGGKHILPMRRAKISVPLYSKKHPDVECGILDWYNSAIRIRSAVRSEIAAFAAEIIDGWRGYTDESVGIFAETDGVPHNSLSPICYRDGDKYVMDFIFRNNITTEEYPDGVYHAHPEYFNIKKEGIGLIEAMGLFILPGRLKRQTAEIERILTGERKITDGELMDKTHDLYVHRDMIRSLVSEHGTSLSGEQAARAVRDYINRVLVKILECTAVFKDDEAGRAAFIKFTRCLGLEMK